MSAAILPFPSVPKCGAESLKDQICKVAEMAARTMVEELMAELDGKDFQGLSDLLRLKGEGVTGAVLGKLLNGIAAESSGAATCPKCGQPCERHSRAERKLKTRHGVLPITRDYHYCGKCQLGFAPFDEAMKLAPQQNQYDLQAAASDLIARMPYDEASEVFERITGQKLSDHAMHDIAARLGDTARVDAVLPTRKKVEAAIEENARGRVWRPILVVAADGAHLPTRPETGSRKGKRGPGGWQEAKGFRIYLVGQERIEQVMSWHQIGSEAEFGEALRFAATLIPTELVRVGLIGDGASWVWSHLLAAFPNGKEILDYYHCSERVHKVADIHYGDNDDSKKALWIESTMSRLFFGDTESVIWGLQRMSVKSEKEAEEIRLLVGYLRTNAKRIDYNKARRGQYPIGSGGIESANKFICHVRMKRSGAWWYKINGNRMLRLRCSIYNGTFDEVFSQYKRRQVRGALDPDKIGRNS